jgi:hypothetical protein
MDLELRLTLLIDFDELREIQGFRLRRANQAGNTGHYLDYSGYQPSDALREEAAQYRPPFLFGCFFRRSAIPVSGFGVVLGDALARFVFMGQIVLGVGVALLGGFEIPLNR